MQPFTQVFVLPITLVLIVNSFSYCQFDWSIRHHRNVLRVLFCLFFDSECWYESSCLFCVRFRSSKAERRSCRFAQAKRTTEVPADLLQTAGKEGEEAKYFASTLCFPKRSTDKEPSPSDTTRMTLF